MEQTKINGALAWANPGLEVESVAVGSGDLPDLLTAQHIKLRILGGERLTVQCQFCRAAFGSWQELARHTGAAHASLQQEVASPGAGFISDASTAQAVPEPVAQFPFYCRASSQQFGRVTELAAGHYSVPVGPSSGTWRLGWCSPRLTSPQCLGPPTAALLK